MTEGLEFVEWNCFAPMVFHSDIVKFIINCPMVHPVGTHMNYNSGCSHILSAIMQQVTNMKTNEFEFAKRYLFQSLGIQEYQWYRDKKKMGLLVLKKGVYNEKRI